jgi:phage-related protein
VIGIGALLLREEPAVRAAAGELAGTAGAVFKGAAAPLIEPFVNSLAILQNLLVDIAPDLSAMFTAVAPAVVPLTRGLAGFVREALPGFLALVKAATPFLMELEHTLPRLGGHVSQFLGTISEGGPQATQFFRDFLHLVGGGLVVFGRLILFLTNWYSGVRRLVLGAIGLWQGYQSAVGSVVGAVTGFFGRLGRFISGVWRTVRGDTGQVVSFMRGVPGRIVSALGNVGSLLYNAGRNVVQGLIDGIKSKFGALAGAASSMAATVRNFLPFSPAKVGPLSGSGSPFRSGQAIARDLAAGMDAGLPTVESAGASLAGAVGGGASAAQAASVGGTLDWAPTATGDQLLDALRDLIRVRFGGSPDTALGSV